MSVQQRFRSFLWKKDTGWRELLVIASALILISALILVVR